MALPANEAKVASVCGLKFCVAGPTVQATLSVIVELNVPRSRLALCCLLLNLPLVASAWGVSFQTRLEKAEWTVSGDQFECRLSQPVTGFGSGEFVRRAGERAVFRLHSAQNSLSAGSATLIAAAAPWQPGRGDINLGAVRATGGVTPFNASFNQSGRLLAGLLEGRSPLVRYSARGGESLEVRLLPVRFSQAYDKYLDCAAKLLPENFDQLKQSRIGFPGGGVELDPAGQARLDALLAYLKADPSINHLLIEGHADNSGSRLTNRDLSRRRAEAVVNYLKAHGVADDQLTMRFHGERYPLVPNTNNANRAKNRRVAIQLERLPQTPDKPAESSETKALATAS